MKKKVFLICLLALGLPVLALAKIGVGVGTGKIIVDQDLKPGLIYTLPSLTVLNTGDEESLYGVGIQYHEYQPEIRPDKSWFKFKPEQFTLKPGEAQLVEIKLTLPLKGAVPGDYFAYLQGFPIRKVDAGGTSVGVAAAAKLYFTVSPANFFSGMYYRIVSLFKLYAPVSYYILWAVAILVLILIGRRFISFNVSIKSVKSKKK